MNRRLHSLAVSLFRSLSAWQNFLIKIQIRNCAKVRIVVIITQHKTISTFCASRRCSPPPADVSPRQHDFLCRHVGTDTIHSRTHTHTHPLNQTLTQAPANNKLRTIQPPKRTCAWAWPWPGATTPQQQQLPPLASPFQAASGFFFGGDAHQLLNTIFMP